MEQLQLGVHYKFDVETKFTTQQENAARLYCEGWKSREGQETNENCQTYEAGETPENHLRGESRN